jgi:xanthine dehydrogenase accessory factor
MELWKFIQKKLSERKNVMLIVVIDSQGSSPGRMGFKMAVSADKELSGSVGGGLMEYNMAELAKKMITKENPEIFIKRQVHNPDAGADSSGLICAGEQTHAFIPLDGSYRNTINEIINCIEKGNKGLLKISQSDFGFYVSEESGDQIKSGIESEKRWEYSELIGLKETLYIFGAGHVSLPISQIFRMLDFRVIIFDDRDDLSTFKINHYAHKKQIIDYLKSGECVADGRNSYAVIMTVGHKSDELVLKQLLLKDLKYLGMIGSRNKVANIFNSLKNEGFSESRLSKVDAPIGLSINSQTPEEIAISIAAKIIQVKNST